MTVKQIWNHANEHREIIHSVKRTLDKGGDINEWMRQLKRHIPCLVGIDAEDSALVFKSADKGLVAVFIQEQGKDFALVLAENIELENQNDAELGMPTMKM